jgi:predicted peptidase
VVSPQSPWPPGFDFSKPHKLTSEETIKLVNSVWKPEELKQLIDHVAGKLNVDTHRIYVTGLSMGGYGTWRLAAAHPELIAAAVPICGGVNIDPEKMARPLTRVPIWAFHGAKDPVVPITESKQMVEAIERAGGEVRFTVYPDAEHDSWTQTYDDQEVYDWLLKHERK